MALQDTLWLQLYARCCDEPGELPKTLPLDELGYAAVMGKLVDAKRGGERPTAEALRNAVAWFYQHKDRLNATQIGTRHTLSTLSVVAINLVRQRELGNPVREETIYSTNPVDLRNIRRRVLDADLWPSQFDILTGFKESTQSGASQPSKERYQQLAADDRPEPRWMSPEGAKEFLTGKVHSAPSIIDNSARRHDKANLFRAFFKPAGRNKRCDVMGILATAAINQLATQEGHDYLAQAMKPAALKQVSG